MTLLLSIPFTTQKTAGAWQPFSTTGAQSILDQIYYMPLKADSGSSAFSWLKAFSRLLSASSAFA